MMTEEEAKTKWCPFMRTPHALGPTANRCIASECMAWRKWTPYYSTIEPYVDEGKGYCGLAGKP
jgi:hypothetical protein